MKKILFLLLFSIISAYFYSIEINISPSEKKQSTDIYLVKGDKISIKTSGTWTLWEKYKPVSAAGHQFITNEYGNWGLLLASVGNSKPFIIGEQKEFVAEDEGVLYLFPNKGNHKMINPSGSIKVLIEGGKTLSEQKSTLLSKGLKIMLDPKSRIFTTNYLLEENKEVEIYAFGNWSMWENVYPEVSPDGHDFTAAGVSWGKLYAGSGSSFGLFNEIFPIGAKSTIKPSKKGILSLFPYLENYNAEPAGLIEVYILGVKEISAEEKNNIDHEIISNIQNSVLNKINEFRRIAKLPLFEQDPILSKTANNHAKYIILNKIFSQEEEEGKTFFTGKNLIERLSKEGYKRKPREILALSENFSSAIDMIINSVYHRLRIMDPALKYLGYGFYKNNENSIHVFDFSYLNDNEEKPLWDYIAYPQNNQTEINTSWNGIESPEPFPLGTIKPLGYPVSLLCSKKIIKINKAEIIDEKGNPVDVFILTAETDLNNKKFNGVVMVPKKVLLPNTRYIVNIETLFDKENTSVKYSWSFVTKTE